MSKIVNYKFLSIGSSVVTSAGKLSRIRNVIHCVGPIYDDSKSSICSLHLAKAIRSALDCALKVYFYYLFIFHFSFIIYCYIKNHKKRVGLFILFYFISKNLLL